MSQDLLIVLLRLGAAILMFALNKPGVDAVALIMMVALPFWARRIAPAPFGTARGCCATAHARRLSQRPVSVSRLGR
ncbi:MAG: hypothetical protein EA400_16460 [Chromatiaceae bacterium]|nr:MAG: hypothetical protein EA400_16460 [Chromatiaceae bacterium]